MSSSSKRKRDAVVSISAAKRQVEAQQRESGALRRAFENLGRLYLGKLRAVRTTQTFTQLQIDCLIDICAFGRNVFCIAGCGSGKSLIAFAALLQLGGSGISCIVTPLNVIKAQHIENLKKLGVKSIIDLQKVKTLDCALSDGTVLVGNAESFLMHFMDANKNILPRIKFFCIDEVRMIIEWGLQFRPAFYKLECLIAQAPNAKYLLLDATVSPAFSNLIVQRLGIKNICYHKKSADLACVYLSFAKTTGSLRLGPKIRKCLELRKKFKGMKGLVLLKSAVAVNSFYKSLLLDLLSARESVDFVDIYYKVKPARYATFQAIPEGILQRRLQKYQRGDLTLLIATRASVGMGIDFNKVSWTYLPDQAHTMSEYLQLVGRTGRGFDSHMSLEVHMDFSVAEFRRARKAAVLNYQLTDTMKTVEERNLLMKEINAFYIFCDGLSCRHVTLKNFVVTTYSGLTKICS